MSALMLVLLGIALGQLRHPKGSTIEPKPKVDTLFLHDTIDNPRPVSDPSSEKITGIKRIPFPVYVQDSSALLKVDSLLARIADLEIVNDSLVMTLKRTQIRYTSPQFQAWVSGYDPSLDSIKIFQTKEIITKEIPVIKKVKPKWGMGFSAGMVTTIKDGKVIAAPGIEFGIHRNILSW